MMFRALATAPLFAALLTSCVAGKTGKFPVPAADQIFSGPAASLAEEACNLQEGKRLSAEFDADVANTLGIQELSLLDYAVMCQNAEGIRALLALGANPNHRDSENRSPVSLAAISPNEVLRAVLSGEISDALKTGEMGAEALERAVRAGGPNGSYDDGWDWSNLRSLLEHGFDPNAGAVEGVITRPALTTMAIGRPEGAAIMLDHGYSHELMRLGRSVYGGAYPDDSPAWAERERVIAMLQARGVDFDELRAEEAARRIDEDLPPFEVPDGYFR